MAHDFVVVFVTPHLPEIARNWNSSHCFLKCSIALYNILLPEIQVSFQMELLSSSLWLAVVRPPLPWFGSTPGWDFLRGALKSEALRTNLPVLLFSVCKCQTFIMVWRQSIPNLPPIIILPLLDIFSHISSPGHLILPWCLLLGGFKPAHSEKMMSAVQN